ncbi:MAG: cupin domain-containing protein [Rhizobiales bacterium]|nr:cupin domain-containing protein [Hyphomicrobiales bacterium]
MIRMTATGVALAAGLLAFGPRLDAQEAAAAAKVRASRIFSATTTANGQPIKLPQGDAEVVVWTYDIPVGARLPVHKHPFPRYAYVLQGMLQVTDVEMSRTSDYKAGDFIVEMVDAWHYGANTGSEPVRLLVVDQVDKGQANTILRY